MAQIDWGDLERVGPRPKSRIYSATRPFDDGHDDEDEEDGPQAAAVPDDDMFELLEVDLPVADTQIRHFVVCSEVQVLITADKRICISDTGRGKFYTYELPGKPDDEIRKCFVCPAGVHCLLNTVQRENYYINCKEEPVAKGGIAKARRCDKLRGVEVEAVGWNKFNQSNADYEKNSGSFLIGTSTGQLLETRLEKDGAKAFKVLYDLKERANDGKAVMGLAVERFPGARSNRWLVIVTTVCRIYQFTGGPTLEALFEDEQYRRSPPFQELPDVIQYSELHVWHEIMKAKTFAWITGVGIMHGRVVFPKAGVDVPRGESLLRDHSIIPYFGGVPNAPLSIAISEFHFYFLYADRLLVVGHPPGLSWTSATEPYDKLKLQDLLGRVDFKFDFQVSHRSQRGLGLTRDAATGMIYAFTPSMIYELVVMNEDKNVWQQFLDRARDPHEREREAYFRRSLKLCQDDSEKRDTVLRAKAEYYFSLQEYGEAAKVWSETSCPFEDVALKFIALQQVDALLQFVLHRIEYIQWRRGTNKQQEVTQLTCLTTWAVQMYLNKLNCLAEEGAGLLAPSQETQHISGEFRKFLQDQKEFLDQPTVQRLIAAHGQVEEEKFFYQLTEDYERLLNYFITQEQDFAGAVKVLTNYCVEEQYTTLWYQFSPTLIERHPDQVVKGWMMDSTSRFLQPTKLMPALVKYNPQQHNPPHVKEDQAMLYLQWLVTEKHNQDPALHNLLVTIYARQPDEVPLLGFLPTSDCYDKAYALRLCLAKGKTFAAVHLYGRLGLYEDAVTAAIKAGDIQLAKNYADQPGDDDPPLRRKLWLQVAQHVIHQQQDMKGAIALLKETRSIKLEDILPFFPDFALIQDFKGEIVQSLEAYNQDIERLKQEMEEATHNADLIRSSLKELRYRYGYVTATQPCDVCGRAALLREFYLFPSCRHVFHQQCLLQLIKGTLTTAILRRIQELERVMSEGERIVKRTDAEAEGPVEAAQRELDALIAAECPYCSEFMIRTIDQPFTPNEAQAQSWAL